MPGCDGAGVGGWPSERPVLSAEDADALGRILAELAYSAYGRRQREQAPQAKENRAPRPVDARPPENKEKLRGPNTRHPADIVPHR